MDENMVNVARAARDVDAQKNPVPAKAKPPLFLGRHSTRSYEKAVEWAKVRAA